MRTIRKLPVLVALALALLSGLTALSASPDQAENSAERAIAWAQAQAGSPAYEYLCEMFVERAYATPKRYADAQTHWNSAPDKHPGDTNPPRGALVFWNQPAPYGHVAISLGNGQVVTTSAPNIGTRPISYFRGYLGWAWSFAPQVVTPPEPSYPANMYFIKTKGGIGHVEVHSATRVSNYQSSSVDSIVNLPVGNVPNGVVKMADMNNDGRADLVYIKTGGGVSNVELHWWNAATGFGGGGDFLTRFSAADGANGLWDVVDGDLYFIKTRGGIGHVEIHSATRASNYQGSSVDRVSNFPVSDATSGLFRAVHMDGDDRVDLAYIKTGVGAGRIELHWRTAAAGFITGGDSTTAFSGASAANGSWDIFNGDLYFVKTGGGAGHVEVHMVTRSSGFQSSGLDYVTRFPASDGPYGLWQISR